MTKSDNKALNFLMQGENSKSLEKFAEYSFLKDIIFEAALNDIKLDIARADFDDFGYDLLITKHSKNTSKSVTVNIQMKAKAGKKTNKWSIRKSLIKDINGRIILIVLQKEKDNKITPRYFMFNSRKYKKEALNTSPKKTKKSNSCIVKKHQFNDITENILRVFEQL